MNDMFFLAVGIILVGVGLLLIMAKIMTYIKCTVPINATVIKQKKEYIYLRGIKNIYYRPIVKYSVDGKSYTEQAYFRTRRKAKYLVDSEINICYNPKKPEEIRFVGHPFPLLMGLAFLFIGAAMIWCYFI